MWMGTESEIILQLEYWRQNNFTSYSLVSLQLRHFKLAFYTRAHEARHAKK